MRHVARFFLISALAACAVNPVTGNRELSLVSESQEIQMGQEAAQQVGAQMGVYPDAGLQRYLDGLGQSIARQSERPNLPWSFTVIDDPVVNAFALPGGPIFFTRGILAHMNSEAQLMSVLGHEIGHVTAKHSVSQMSKSQFAQIGLIGAMIIKPELQQFGELGSSALGVLFMKFGRDDETQADELGFKYMTNLNYDPSEMAEMFKTLERLGGGSQGTPEWLSTHPDPGNRVAMTRDRISAWTHGAGRLKVERDSYLRRLDGVVFGEDPRAGYFKQNVFLHPTLKFRVDFPSGWRTANQASQVLGVSSAQDAMLAISAGKGSASQAMQQFLSQQGLQSNGASNTRINGLTASSAQFAAQTQQGVLMGHVVFIELDGSTYRMLAYTGQQQFNSYDQVFRRALGSFQRLTDPAALNVKPDLIRLVETPSAMTIEQFNARYPSTIPIDKLALINGFAGPSATIPARTLVKRVMAQ